MCKYTDFKTFSNRPIDQEVQGLYVYSTSKEKRHEWKDKVKDIRDQLEITDGFQFDN